MTPARGPLAQQQLSLVILQDDNATVVALMAPWGAYSTGSSKREPGDGKNFGRGYRIATARAMIRLGEAILKDERQQIRRESRLLEQEVTPVEVELERPAPSKEQQERINALRNSPEAVRKRSERAQRRGAAIHERMINR
jgi:hypothetical protein